MALSFGLLGLFGLLLGLGLVIWGYQSGDGREFSLLNHSLSELGSYGHSKLAVLLNGGLFFGSLSLVLCWLFTLQLSRLLSGHLLYLSLTLTCMALAGVGLFPVNVYHLHILMLKWFLSLAVSVLAATWFICCSALWCRHSVDSDPGAYQRRQSGRVSVSTAS